MIAPHVPIPATQMRATSLFLAIGLTLAVTAAPLPAQSPAADSLAVTTVVQRFHDALARGDSAAALGLLAEDAVVLEAGGVETRAEYRGHHLPADIRFVQAVPGKAGPSRVVVQGDVAWVSGSSENVGSFDGRAVNSTSAELMVLSRTPAGWRIRAIHWSSRRRTAP